MSLRASGTRYAQRRVVVIGAGVAGLSAAHTLTRTRRDGDPAIDVLLLEAGSRAGGHVLTERMGEFVLDAGPDGVLASKPHALALGDRLGLGARWISPRRGSGRLYVLHRGRLVPMPEGVVLAAPTNVRAMVATPLLSWRAKARMALDLLIPPADESARDESLGGFITRRLGREASELFAGSFLAGIHGGDPDRLSVLATFPQLVAMEREHGGLIRGAVAMRRAAERKPSERGSPFRSLPNGMQEFTDALVASLPEGTLRLGTAVRGLSRSGTLVRVRTDEGVIDADGVIIAVSPGHAARLLRDIDGPAASQLERTTHASSVSMFLAFPRGDVRHELDASGFVVPRRERSPIQAVTFISSKWDGRAPDGTVLLRVTMGGARDPGVLDRTDAQLVEQACALLADVLGFRAHPMMSRVFRHREALPQMEIGHLDRMQRVRARLSGLPQIALAAAGFDGVGIPDCVRQGTAAAERVREGLRNTGATFARSEMT